MVLGYKISHPRTVWMFAVIASLAATIIGQPPVRQLLLRDTSRAVARGRSAQELFERARRALLPYQPGSHGRCDEQIGRFCYWYDGSDTTLPVEPASIRAARSQLLATLASAQADRPTSDWLVGQRVRYLIEQEAADSAVAAARTCGGTEWWCRAVLGLGLHAAERYDQAEASFAAALAAMPESLRCLWTDWAKLLDDPVASRFGKLACGERLALADTLLWLGQPLLSRPGNDLRTELLARRVMAAIHSVARSPHQIPWADDLDEMTLRYGWPVRWAAVDQGRFLEAPPVSGLDRSPGYRFLPVPADSGWTWELEPQRPRSRYAPTRVRRVIAATDYQIARFPRGDSTIVVAGLSVGDDPAFRGTRFSLGVAAGIGPDRPIVIARRDSAQSLGGLVVRLAGDAAVVSVEAEPIATRTAARARVYFTARDRSPPVLLSDPLLFAPADELPATLEDAARLALATTAVSRRVPVGVYWEATGSSGDSATVALSVEPIRRGFLGRIGEGLSVVKRRAPLTLQWHASTPTGDTFGRAVELDLSRLDPGRYRLRLETAGPSGVAATTRPIVLRP